MLFLIGIVNFLFNIYFFIVLIRVIISWVGGDPYNPVVQFIRRITDPLFFGIKRILPFPTVVGMIDLAPMIVIFLLIFLRAFIIKMLLLLAQ